MPDEKPIVYLLRGDDREEIETKLSDFTQRLGTPDMAEMNTTRLQGKSTSLNDLRAAALAMPFLTERRLVIVEDALAPYKGSGKQKTREELLALLDSLPQTTALVLILPDSRRYRRGGYEWESLKDSHWMIKWAVNARPRALILDCALPSEAEMVNWVRGKAVELGGSFSPGAAAILAEYVGNNTQRATREIEKLLTYVAFQRPVDDDDVRRLTSQDQEGDIFGMVDAIGSRNGKEALRLLHILLEDGELLQIFGMVTRQFRLLIQAREILDSGGSEDGVRSQLNLHPWVAQKVTAQARQFNLSGLDEIYQQLLKIDVDGKSGGMPVDLALDVLIARLAG
jgi:DNA polymerase-3 subunit delta